MLKCFLAATHGKHRGLLRGALWTDVASVTSSGIVGASSAVVSYWARKAVVYRRHSLVRLPGAGGALLGRCSLLDLLTVVTDGAWPLQVVCDAEAVAIVSLRALEALL